MKLPTVQDILYKKWVTRTAPSDDNSNLNQPTSTVYHNLSIWPTLKPIMPKTTSNSSDSSSKKRSNETDAGRKADIRERNTASVRRHRERAKAQDRHIMNQFEKNVERIRTLEATVAQISDELREGDSRSKQAGSSKKKKDKGSSHRQGSNSNGYHDIDERPSWFGQPF